MYSAYFSILIGILLVCPETASLTWTGQPANPTEVLEGNNVVLTWSYSLTADEQTNSQSFFSIVWFKFNLSSWVFDRIASKTFISALAPNSLFYQEPLSPHIVIDKNDKTDLVTLQINNVNTDDEGQYKIRYVKDSDGNVLAELAMNLTVHDPPSNIVTSSDQTVSLYDELSLNCSADGRPKPTITWTRLSDNTIVIMPFNISSRQYGGYYRCTADNGVGHSLTKDVFINVLFPPIITIESKLFVGREQTASLNCKVEGNPTPWIHWTPCDLPSIGCDKQYLNISKVQTSRAHYTCTASNYVGNRSETTLLIIGGTNIFISLSTSGECDEKDSVWGSLQNEAMALFIAFVMHRSF